MKTPKFTDSHNHIRPYASAEASRRPGYLRAKFTRIRAEHATAEAEAKAKVKPLKKAAG